MKKFITLSILLAIVVGWFTPPQYLWVLWLGAFLLAARFLPTRSDDCAKGMLLAEIWVAVIAIGIYIAFPDRFGIIQTSITLLLIALIPYTLRVKRVENNNRLNRQLVAMQHLQQQR